MRNYPPGDETPSIKHPDDVSIYPRETAINQHTSFVPPPSEIAVVVLPLLITPAKSAPANKQTQSMQYTIAKEALASGPVNRPGPVSVSASHASVLRVGNRNRATAREVI